MLLDERLGADADLAPVIEDREAAALGDAGHGHGSSLTGGGILAPPVRRRTWRKLRFQSAGRLAQDCRTPPFPAADRLDHVKPFTDLRGPRTYLRTAVNQLRVFRDTHVIEGHHAALLTSGKQII